MADTGTLSLNEHKVVEVKEGENENIYSVISDSSISLSGSLNTDAPYVSCKIVSNPAVTQSSWWSWKRRCLALLFLACVIICVIAVSVSTTLVVMKGKDERQHLSSTTTPNLRTSEMSTTPLSYTASRNSTKTTTTDNSTYPPSVNTTRTTSATSTTTPSATTTTTIKEATNTTQYNCSAPHRCHTCTSREQNGRCPANGQLVDTERYGMVQTCSTACFAEVRGTDENYVHRGCVSSEGSKVEDKVSLENPGCVNLTKWEGAGVSTYCFCCGDLCNTQNMTKYGGKDV